MIKAFRKGNIEQTTLRRGLRGSDPVLATQYSLCRKNSALGCDDTAIEVVMG